MAPEEERSLSRKKEIIKLSLKDLINEADYNRIEEILQ